MARALGWLALGGVALLVVVVLLAPLEMAGRAFVLAALTVVPGLLVLAVAATARRRRGGHVSTADRFPADRPPRLNRPADMDPTLRAALTAFVIGIVVVGGAAWFLGVGQGPAIVAGLVAGVLLGGLILAAARRSRQFHGDDPHRFR